jgi:argininosuccinate lyase
MEHLIRRGIPQRTGHHLVGQLVKAATEQNITLSELPLAAFQAAEPKLDAGVYGVLGVEKAVQAYRTYGSSAPAEVRKQIDRWKQELKV